MITIVTHERRRLFSDKENAEALAELILKGAINEDAELYAFCIMPDHLHVLVAPKDENLADIIRRWKSYTTNRLQKRGHEGQLWQKGFHDHALRKEEAIADVMLYIVNNPVRKGMVEHWEGYPYSWIRT